MLRIAITLSFCLFAVTAAWASPPIQVATQAGQQNNQEQNPELLAISKAILHLTNQIRAQHGAPPLQGLSELDHAAKYHSSNMAKNNFFSHRDPGGLQPSERIKKLHPELSNRGSGENIAMRSTFAGDSPDDIARNLVIQWKNSPGHFKNMIAKDFSHLGVGVAYRGQNIYATQVFSKPLVRLESPLKSPVLAGKPVVLRLRLLANFPAKELYVYLKVPDKAARFYTDSGSYYTGGGPLQIQWPEAGLAEITIPTDKGIGLYQIGVGQNGSYAPGVYQFEALPAAPTQTN